MVFNKSVKTKDNYDKIRNKIVSRLGYYKHPKNLTKEDIKWLKKNIKQFDKKVLDKIIQDSVLPDKPKLNNHKGNKIKR
jgi:arabinogalactan endo-1,4-beta-galactosidase